MSTLEQLGAYLASGAGKALTPAANEALRLHFADTLAAWMAGARTHEGKDLRASARQGAKSPMGEGILAEVMLNCALTRLSEIDDIHLAAGTTPGSLIAPTALTLAARLGINRPADLLEAVAGGYDVLVRFGEEIGGATALYRGIWPTYFNAPLGTAAVAARLLGLDARQCAHALALALAMGAPNVGQAGGKLGRWLLLGSAARNGVAAAFAAADGFCGDLALLDKPFHGVFGITVDGPRFIASLAKGPSILEIGYKPWCAARQTMAAAQGFKEIMAGGVTPESVRSIRVKVPPAYLAMVNHGVVPGDRSSHMTSLPYQLVLAALAPENMYSLEFAPNPTPEAHKTWLGKITVSADDALNVHFPRAWPAAVEVISVAGTQQRLVTDIPGDPARTFDETQVRQKYDQVLGPLLGTETTRSLAGDALSALARPADASALLAKIVATYS